MKTLVILFTILISLPALVQSQDKTGTTAAPFLNIATNARAIAMGSAFSAIADDENALYVNPGGLATLDYNTASFSNTSYFVGTSFQEVTAIIANPSSGSFGIRFMVLNYGDEDVTTIANPEGTGERWSAMDMSIGLTYSRYLTTEFSFGATAKYVSQRIWNSTSEGFALDVGVLYKSSFKNLRIGMSISNFGSEMQMQGDDLKKAIDIDENNNGNNDRLPAFLATNPWEMPLLFKVGLAMDILEAKSNRLTVAFDAKQPSDNSSSVDVGLEYGFNDLLFIRGGYRSLFGKVISDGGFTTGFGLKYAMTTRNTVNLGFAYQVHEYLGNPTTLTLSVTF